MRIEIKIKRLCGLILFLIVANNLWAQQREWEDPYLQQSSPGYYELYQAQVSMQTKDFKSTRKWLGESADKGNLRAGLILAEMLLEGKGGSVDLKKGIEYYFYAVSQGYVLACHRLGTFYIEGKYVSKNLDTGFYYIKKSVDIDENYIDGKWALGRCYVEGIGIPKDVVKGIKLYKDVALSGNTNSASIAQVYLGLFYYDEEEYNEAAKWFSMAENHSNTRADAKNNLAHMYAKGKGFSQDFTKAHALIREARAAAKLQYGDNTTELLSIQARLLDSEGEFYLIENKMDEAMATWNQFKLKYPELIEEKLSDPRDVFVLTMYKQEQQMQNNLLASNNDNKHFSPSIISDVDEKIPENTIVENPTFAVIIANENYKEEEGVPYAIRDGEIFKEYCEKTLGIPKSNIKFETDATFNSIKRQLNWLGQVMDVYQGEANIIFYYAGHGIPNEKNQSAYLLPVDGYGSDVTTGYSLDKLYADLSDKPAKSVVVLLDACFSGAKRDGGMLASARGVAIKAKQNTPKGNMIVFSAAQGDETAYPYKEKGHGIFTYYLMKKLQETKGDVTFGELADYVTSEVKKQSVVVNGKVQTPKVTTSPSVADTWQNMKLR